jgi:hypothetical protein
VDSFAGIPQLGFVPAGWEGRIGTRTNGPYAGWSYTNCNIAWQARPYTATFLARSEYRQFKRARDGNVIMSLAMFGGYHGNFSTNR